jgi:hypothetical protein
MTIRQSPNKYNQAQSIERLHWVETTDFSKMELSLLRIIEEEIKELCLEFDPYAPNNNLKKCLPLLKKYELETFVSNPFTFTSKLLRLMDKVEQSLKQHIQ